MGLHGDPRGVEARWGCGVSCIAANRVLGEIFGRVAAAGDLVGTHAVALHARLGELTANPAAFADRGAEIVRARTLVSAEWIELPTGISSSGTTCPVTTSDGQFIAHFWRYRNLGSAPTRATSLLNN